MVNNGKSNNNNNKGKRKQPGSMKSVSVVANNTQTRSKPPSLQRSNGGTLVGHREVSIDRIEGDAIFSVNSKFCVQPGLSTYSRGSPLGTWLPRIAKEYDQYRFKKLKFHFITTCSTLTNGLVVLSYDPNPDAQPPVSFADARNSAYCVTGPVRQNLSIDLTKYVSSKKLFTREGNVVSLPNYDAGSFYISTTQCGEVGSPAPLIGYVEVEYEVELSNPQTAPAIIGSFGPAVVNPCITFVGTTDIGTARSVGLTNTNRNGSLFTFSFIQSAAATYGVSGLMTINNATRTTSLNYVSPNTGITYTCSTSNANWRNFQFKRVGCWRLTGVFNADWADYATFGLGLLEFKTGAALTSGNPSDPLDVATDTLGNPAGVPVKYSAFRGFKSTGTVGAQDNDEIGPAIDATFVVPSTDYFYTLALGVRDVTNISENNDAIYTCKNGSGLTQLTFEFLGECALPTGLTPAYTSQM